MYEYSLGMADLTPHQRALRLIRARGFLLPDDITGELEWPLSHVRFGLSARTQVEFDAGIGWLLRTPAAYRWLSLEPLLESINLHPHLRCCWHCSAPPLENCGGHGHGYKNRPNEVVVGGERGPHPMHPDWVRAVRDDCIAAGVAFTFKQWGDWAPSEPGKDSVLVPGAVKDHSLGPKRVHWLYPDGRHIAVDVGTDLPDPEVLTMHVGKRAAGRMLDGRTWEGD